MDNKEPPRAASASLLEQAARFDREAAEYNAHHANSAALEYRDRFYRSRLCGFDMHGKRILDAMCATGIDTPYLLSRGGNVCGLDISKNCAAVYEQRFRRPCIVGSIHQTGFDDSSFDVVYVSGGLHHVSNTIGPALREIYRILAPGGLLCFVEPNADSWADGLRRYWYARSERFGHDERALNYRRELKPYLSLGFVEEDYFCGGNFAYLLVQQSNILKTPNVVLRRLKAPLFALERFIAFLPFAPKLYLCARWRKTA